MSPTEPETSITNDDVKHLLNLGDGVVSMGYTIGRASIFKPTEVFCNKDGTILQLWIDTCSQDIREWRQLPTFEEARKRYNCVRVA
jgi:hypothetical protein